MHSMKHLQIFTWTAKYSFVYALDNAIVQIKEM